MRILHSIFTFFVYFQIAITLLIGALFIANLRARHFRHAQKRLKRAVASQIRKRRADLESKYECVGGPYDGELVVWKQPQLSMYVSSGTYNLERDTRLHYEHLSPIAFGGEDPEC